MKYHYRNIEAKDYSFFSLSSEFSDVASFRRILSLLRINENCETIAIRETNFDIDKRECGALLEGSRKCRSCLNYITQMDCDSARTLVTKKCVKFFFFDRPIPDGVKIDPNQFEEHLIGYCTVHTDTIKYKDGSTNDLYRSYVPECVLIGLRKDIQGFKYGTFQDTVIIDGNQFNIKRGTYFSQQNGLTNFCAHAAIKTALRGYDIEISSESINTALSKKFPRRVSNIANMSKGLSIPEMSSAIIELSSKSSYIDELYPMEIDARKLSITQFIETVYRAIESKIPVILLFRIPNIYETVGGFRGHAISIIGHTFNINNWNAYGSGYFSDNSKISYLSSFLWCDNFVVQDDNFGPAYHLSCSFLADYFDYGVAVEKLSSKKPSDNNQPTYPLSALILSPNDLREYTKELHNVEQIAASYFRDAVEKLGLHRVFKELFNEQQMELFKRYFYYLFEYDIGNKQRVFISRTMLVSKKEHLKSEAVSTIFDNNIFHETDRPVAEVVSDSLSDYFWLSEISVPELYWVNKHKIGEIIIDVDSTNSEEMPEFSTNTAPKLIKRLIRLPYFIAIFLKQKDEYLYSYLEHQTEPHHKILKKEEGLVRQFANGG